MRIEKKSNHVFLLTLSTYELASLISSARWAAEGAKGEELSAEAVDHLKQVLASYDNAVSNIRQNLPEEVNY